MKLDRILGLNDGVGVHSLVSMESSKIFYVCSNVGVIFDCNSGFQQLLHGHKNAISAACINKEKRLIATADTGEGSAVIIWNASGNQLKEVPVLNGIEAIDFASNGRIAALSVASKEEVQHIYIWEKTSQDDFECICSEFVTKGTYNTCIKFNPVDDTELITNGRRDVCFWHLTPESELIPSKPVHQKRILRDTEEFCVSTFITGTRQAVSSTSLGEVVIWGDSIHKTTNDSFDEKKVVYPCKYLVKKIKLCEGSVNVLIVVRDYLVVAGEDGSVRFYDFSLRIVAWFEDLNAGMVTSVDFGTDFCCDESSFDVPDFVVGTKKRLAIGVKAESFNEAQPENRQGSVLVQGLTEEIAAIATHPSKAGQVMIADKNGGIIKWDISNRSLSTGRNIMIQPSCLQYHPNGETIIIGTVTGKLALMDSETLEESISFDIGDCSISNIRVSPDGEWIASSDSQHHVALYKKPSLSDENRAPRERNNTLSSPKWVYVGRYQSHSCTISGLEFCQRENGDLALISVSEDRFLGEYNVRASSEEKGVCLETRVRIENTGIPTACMWHPLLGEDYEERIITANDEFKFNQYNADDKSFRRKTLFPSSHGHVDTLISLPLHAASSPSPFLAYSTTGNMLGVMKMPLDGKSNNCTNIAHAHPEKFSALEASCDGRFIFSSCVNGRCVNVWKTETANLDKQIASDSVHEGIGMNFLDAETKEALEEFFYYVQIRGLDEESVAEKKKNMEKIDLSQVPSLVRALGYFPSEKEVEDMLSDMSTRDFTTTGEIIDSINLDEFAQLFVNYGTVQNFEDEVKDAIDALEAKHGRMSWEDLVVLLKEKGERMTDGELDKCAKVGLIPEDLSDKINSVEFSKLIF